MKLNLVASVAFVCSSSFAMAGTIDFSTSGGAALSDGDVLTTFDFGAGITGSASAVNSNGSGVNTALVFDTDLSYTADPDLESPFALAGSNGAVTRSFGNAVVVQENAAIDDVFTPDDDGRGGVLTFAFDNLIELGVLSLLDVEQNTSVTLFNDGAVVATLFADSADTNNSVTPNLFTTVDFGGQVGNSFAIDFNGRSGGLGEFVASSTVSNNAPAPVPLPAAGWMLLAGVGGLFGVRRKARK